MAMRYPGGLIATSPVNAAYPSGVWTQSQTIPYASQNVWQQDQYWRNTTLLLHGDGTNGAQNNTFLDSSSNNFTITRNGNTTQGAFTPYQQNGYWSNYFDGASSLLPASNAAFNFGTGDFTVEAWVYQPASGTQCVYDSRGSDASSAGFFFGTISTNFVVYTGGTSVISTAMPLNAWTHLAVARSGSTWTLYKNGVSAGTYSSSANLSDANRQIGASTTVTSSSANYLTGYISNLRVVKGTAVYTSAFTPSTAPLTAITNTSLLTCQSNRFVDNSSNAFAITVTGTPSVQAFQPFPGPTTWSASVLGGSGYFDGTASSLVTTNNVTTIGTQDFCLEAWVYCLSTTNYACIIGTDGVSCFIEMGTLRGIFLGGPEVSMGSVIYNQWVHLAYCRVSGTYAGYVNGVRQVTGTYSSNLSTAVKIGINNYAVNSISGYGITGYIANPRMVVGSSPYSPSSTTITVPTSPLTAVTNTLLLVNMTNAGIFDNAQMNNLGTVGNAQVSTSVVKYGTGSMAFDGSGDYLPVPYSPNLNMGTGDFTCEFWVYVPSNPSVSYPSIVGPQDQIPYGIGIRYGNTGYANKFTVHLYGVAGWVGDPILASSTYSLSQWHHVALTRSGTTLTLWVNGVSAASTTSSNQIDFASDNKAMWIGASFDGANSYFNGYIDDFRITKGVARYTANFTPPIARMPNQ